MGDIENRLNTTSVAAIACISLVYLCSFVNRDLATAALFSVVPLYFFVQRNHARWNIFDKLWRLEGAWKYVFPFVIYIVIGELVQGLLVGYETYHLYAAYGLRTLIVGGILLRYRSLYTELNAQRLDVMALLVGVLIFALWVGLEGHYPLFFSASSHFDPTVFGTDTDMVIMLLSLRLVGSVLVAAFIEELFCRSFLMRYVIDPEKWADIPVGTYTFMSFVVVALFFGFAHFRWLPGILTGIVLNLLLYKRRNIFSCAEAHGMSNLLLFVYVVYTESWFFW